MNKLNIFVSSTCYDLSQIRADIKQFIENQGYNPILSENQNFPFNPFTKAVESCVEIVKKEADILVLIIGNRYGSQLESGKSITNSEYLTAKQKGIPIYVFISKGILNLLPVWEKNPNINLEGIVDTDLIFRFIKDVRNVDNNWTFEFENAQDISNTLKAQWANLFKDSLVLRSKFNNIIDESFVENLSNQALRIYFTKGNLFEYEFFFQVLKDEIQKKESLKLDYDYQLLYHSKFLISNNDELLNWAQQRFLILKNLSVSLKNLFTNALPVFIGESGSPADLKGFYLFALSYAKIFESFVVWYCDIRTAQVNEENRVLMIKLSELATKIIEEMWIFPFEKYNSFQIAKNKYQQGETCLKINANLTLDIDEISLDEYNAEFELFSTRIMKLKSLN